MNTNAKKFTSIVSSTLALLISITTAAAEVNYERMKVEFTSPNNITEQCVAITKLPMGNYKKDDVEEELRLCNLNFYNNTVALCPKTWSTSPGTIVSSFENLAPSSEAAEAKLCKYHSSLKKEAKFKQTMNQADTSGTFSAASILYYHFSRALDTSVKVPAAVYRTMDKKAHYDRVTSKAHPTEKAKMNFAGWNWMLTAETNAESYNQKSDLFTTDLKQIYGVLFKDKGEPYGAEINGTKQHGWGEGQNYDFQKTPAFLALKSSADLETAITEGYTTAIADPLMKTAFSSGAPSKQQMILWMNELSEIAILDYIFNQQDRIDNIDYIWHWSYVDQDGRVQIEKVKEDAYKSLSRKNMGKIKPPAELLDKKPILIQRTTLGDNDAGGLHKYANYTKMTGMLGNLAGSNKIDNPIKHINLETYKRLLTLANDLKNKGPNYQVLKEEIRPLGYNDAADKRFNLLINNTLSVAEILEKNCQSGVLKLDLVSFKKAMKNDFSAEKADCCANKQP